MVQDHINNNAGKAEDEEDEDDDERIEVLRESVEVLCAALKTHGAAIIPKIQNSVLRLYGQLLTDKCVFFCLPRLTIKASSLVNSSKRLFSASSLVSHVSQLKRHRVRRFPACDPEVSWRCHLTEI